MAIHRGAVAKDTGGPRVEAVLFTQYVAGQTGTFVNSSQHANLALRAKGLCAFISDTKLENYWKRLRWGFLMHSN